MRIETLEKWNETAAKLTERGYTLFQTQFDVDLPQGYHARFTAHDMPDVEIVTRSQEVRDAIVRYEPMK